MSHKNNMRLVTVALLIALEVILGTFFTFNFAGIAKIGFGFLPIAMIAIMYGPLWAGTAYAIGDVLAWFIKPEGAYFPGLTLTCFLVGVVMGLFLYKKEVTFQRCALCFLVTVFFLDFLLNTFWLHILMEQGFLALLPTRAVKCLITYAMEVLLVPLLWNGVMVRIPAVHELMSSDGPEKK
ncbi:MAG: folate family ECF transporter S component [Eubacterium sp.]|nr:folate family ECF transporter S component [Eubacterium sp.]